MLLYDCVPDLKIFYEHWQSVTLLTDKPAKSVVEITVGHQSWPTRFPIWPNNFFLKFAEMSDYWMRYLDSEMWQAACVWHGRWNEKKKVC